VTSIAALIADLVGPEEAGLAPASLRRPDVRTALAMCRPGEVVAARDGDEHVAVMRLASGEACVLADECPHDGGPLSDGFIEGDRLVCSRHQWELDPRTGICPHRAGALVTVRSVHR
jgi:nitrite reductase/ring-hydroxylating ferredoxin subunit